ncbi:SDR family NAD(P)-dependent oxidoreductase [Nocardioides alcanivorans]|uniref:SDR family NAD(P)-dependent oxidoreductase n=1 Tax=Nocardioides alcanivorans TaxID=2897352 RepID=UPI001F384736|nr:SDR family NAD(P)-dependent oxidoreductase [Nocardioides alcanivorans]
MGLLWQTPAVLLRRLTEVVAGRRESPLLGRTVMVTGASSGIGEATAHEVAARGGRVLLVARRVDELERVRRAIEERGGEAEAWAVDLTDAAAVDAFVAEVLARHSAVDHLVNNAGRSIRRSLDLSYDRIHDFERTMAINYFAPLRLILGLLPAMRAQGFGHVVNIVTWGVQMKAPKFSAYIASKTALDTFSRIAGRETYGDNVTFSNVRLPLVRTGMIAATEAYATAPAMSVEQAARIVVHALEERPITVSVPVARVAEVANLLAPRLTDAVAWAASRRFPDSAAARAGNAGDLTAPR